MRSKEKREPESIVREIKRKTRRKFTSEEKIRIVLEGLQGESSLAYVKDQMGHASIQTTVDVYGHLVPGANKHEVDRLDEILAKNAPKTHPDKKEGSQETLQPLNFKW